VEYRYSGQRLSGLQSFVCCVSRKSATMIKGSFLICDEWFATSCDAERIANLVDFFPSQTLHVFCFSFAKPSDFLFGPGTICSSGIMK
jgi:hypothetical protein